MTFFPGHLPTHPPTHLSPSSTQRKSTHTAGKNEAPENVTPPAWLFSLTYPPTHLPTSHRHARSGKPRTQQGKKDPRKCNASSVTFSPGPPTHLHTYTPLAFKHAVEKHAHSKEKRDHRKCNTSSVAFFPGADFHAPRVVSPRPFPWAHQGPTRPRFWASSCRGVVTHPPPPTTHPQRSAHPTHLPTYLPTNRFIVLLIEVGVVIFSRQGQEKRER